MPSCKFPPESLCPAACKPKPVLPLAVSLKWQEARAFRDLKHISIISASYNIDRYKGQPQSTTNMNYIFKEGQEKIVCKKTSNHMQWVIQTTPTQAGPPRSPLPPSGQTKLPPFYLMLYTHQPTLVNKNMMHLHFMAHQFADMQSNTKYDALQLTSDSFMCLRVCISKLLLFTWWWRPKSRVPRTCAKASLFSCATVSG